MKFDFYSNEREEKCKVTFDDHLESLSAHS